MNAQFNFALLSCIRALLLCFALSALLFGLCLSGFAVRFASGFAFVGRSKKAKANPNSIQFVAIEFTRDATTKPSSAQAADKQAPSFESKLDATPTQETTQERKPKKLFLQFEHKTGRSRLLIAEMLENLSSINQAKIAFFARRCKQH